jgi:tetratricopeptide (TPR) repeat protein
MREFFQFRISYFLICVLSVLVSLNSLLAEDSTERSNDSLTAAINDAAELLSNNPEKFFQVAQELKKSSLAVEDSTSYSKVMLYEGVHHAMKGNLDDALRIFFDVWTFAYRSEDPRLQLSALNNIAGVYRYSGNYEKAEEYMLKALELWDDNEKLDVDRGQLLLSLGMVVTVLDRIDEAQEYLHQALEIFKENKEYDLMLQTMSELAFVMERNGEFAQSMSVYKSMIPLFKYDNDFRSVLTTEQRMGGVSLKMGLYTQAYAQLKHSLVLSDSLGYDVQKDSTLVRLIKTTAHLGKLQEMENYVHQLSKFHSEKEAQSIERKIGDLETKHELTEQKLENEILKRETENQKLALLNFRYLMFGGVGLFLIVAILFLTVYKYNDRVKKYSEELTRTNDELEKHVAAKTELLDNRNMQLIQASFALAHEIRAKVATILGASALLNHQSLDQESLDLLEAVKESSEELDVVVRDLISRLED